MTESRTFIHRDVIIESAISADDKLHFLSIQTAVGVVENIAIDRKTGRVNQFMTMVPDDTGELRRVKNVRRSSAVQEQTPVCDDGNGTQPDIAIDALQS